MSTNTAKLFNLIFRYGFASIFLVNAVVAIVDPDSFRSILEKNVIADAVGYHDLMLGIVIVNDLILGLLILLDRYYKRVVYAWAGLWLLLIAVIKVMNLIW